MQEEQRKDVDIGWTKPPPQAAAPAPPRATTQCAHHHARSRARPPQTAPSAGRRVPHLSSPNRRTAPCTRLSRPRAELPLALSKRYSRSLAPHPAARGGGARYDKTCRAAQITYHSPYTPSGCAIALVRLFWRYLSRFHPIPPSNSIPSPVTRTPRQRPPRARPPLLAATRPGRRSPRHARGATACCRRRQPAGGRR